MAENINDNIFDALKDLDDDQFKEFKFKLCSRELKPRIRKGEVEKADRLDVVQIIIDRHTAGRAGSVTVNVLRSINCNAVADDLEENIETAPSCSAAPGPGPDTTTEKHFIDLHRTDLIERVSNVTAILDRLLEKGVITQMGYDDILAENTKQNRMRKLFNGPINAGGKRAKDVLYEILDSQESFLMSDLK